MIVDKLKKIVSTLGGSYTAKDDSVSELLEQINTAFVNGGGGGGSALPVYVPFTVTVDEETGAVSASTTANFADIKAAVAAGKNVVAEIALDEITVYGALAAKIPAANPAILAFSLVVDFGDSGEAPEPLLMQIGFEENAVEAKAINLTVAT